MIFLYLAFLFIAKYTKQFLIVKMCFSPMNREYPDRVIDCYVGYSLEYKKYHQEMKERIMAMKKSSRWYHDPDIECVLYNEKYNRIVLRAFLHLEYTNRFIRREIDYNKTHKRRSPGYTFDDTLVETKVAWVKRNIRKLIMSTNFDDATKQKMCEFASRGRPNYPKFDDDLVEYIFYDIAFQLLELYTPIYHAELVFLRNNVERRIMKNIS
jgi:hypothetical protein